MTHDRPLTNNSKLIDATSRLPVMVVSVAVYYLSFATYFCVKKLKITISEDIVMRKRPSIRSRSSKVIHFGTNGKRVYTFLLVINNNFSHIFAPFWRYGGLKAKNHKFCLPHRYLTLPLRGNPSKFRDYTCCWKTRGMGLLYCKNCMMLAPTVFEILAPRVGSSYMTSYRQSIVTYALEGTI